MKEKLSSSPFGHPGTYNYSLILKILSNYNYQQQVHLQINSPTQYLKAWVVLVYISSRAFRPTQIFWSKCSSVRPYDVTNLVPRQNLRIIPTLVLSVFFTLNNSIDTENQCESYPLTPLCVACKYKRIFAVLDVLKIRKMNPDIFACNYVRIYLHASLTYFPNIF